MGATRTEEQVALWEEADRKRAKPNGKAPVVSLQTRAALDAETPNSFEWADTEGWDSEVCPPREWAVTTGYRCVR